MARNTSAECGVADLHPSKGMKCNGNNRMAEELGLDTVLSVGFDEGVVERWDVAPAVFATSTNEGDDPWSLSTLFCGSGPSPSAKMSRIVTAHRQFAGYLEIVQSPSDSSVVLRIPFLG
jgi:hypothetical protein